MKDWNSVKFCMVAALCFSLAAEAAQADPAELTLEERRMLSELAYGPKAPPALFDETDPRLAAKKGEVVTGSDPREFFFVRKNRFTTPLIDRSGTYEFQSSAIRNANGTMDVWFCGGQTDSGQPTYGHDAIYKASFNSSNVAVGSVSVAVTHAYAGGVPHLGEPDGVFACDNTVIKHGYNGLSWSGGIIPSTVTELYLMYYECSGYFTDRDATANKLYPGPNQICLAASADGSTWMKYNNALGGGHEFGAFSSTVPTPVVALDAGTKAWCDWSDTAIPGEYVADYPECLHIPKAYGMGHPSAVSLPKAGGGREVWLYYTAPKGTDALYTYLRKSTTDGISFGSEIPILGPGDQQIGLGKVRYFDVRIGDHQGVFIATHAFGTVDAYGVVGGNHFNYSFDGVHFASIPVVPYDAGYRMAEVKADEQDAGPSLCTVAGSPTLIADKYGVIDRLTGVEMLSSEGKLSQAELGDSPSYCYDAAEDTNRGGTWALYLLNGDFGHIAPEEADVCELYDKQNVRDQYERGEELTGTQGSIVWVDDYQFWSYLGWTDFQVKNNYQGGKAYIDVNNATYDRVEACDYGGVRDICGMFKFTGGNINKGFSPNSGTKFWFDGSGDRYSYGTDATHNFTYLNYGNSSSYTNITDSNLWDALINQCTLIGDRQPTVCHTYNASNARSPAGTIEWVEWGNRYGYSGWCCGANSYLALDTNGNWTNVTSTVWNDLQATCPYVGLRGVLNP
jgi:hypothetical protein